MPNIKLSDGKLISFKNNITGSEVAEKISKSLLKNALSDHETHSIGVKSSI